MTQASPARQIFIHDQPLWELQLTGGRTLDWLKPERFRLAGLPDDELRLADVDHNPWEPVTHASMLNDLKSGRVQRLCVTTNAGIGKSTFLKWLQRQLSQKDSRLVPFRLELRELPNDVDQFLSQSFERKLRSRRQTGAHSQHSQNPRELLDRLLRQKRLCLLVDSLDQTSRNLDAQIKALAEFLKSEFTDCPVVVAGRPHAITHFWDDLFAAEPSKDPSWQILQPGMFTDDQVQRYLGPKRHGQLQSLGVNVRQNPRAISVIARLSETRLSQLRTEADVYWEMLDEQLELALRVHAVEGLERPHVEFLFCLIAFRLLQDGNRAEVAATDYGEFIQQLCRDRQADICRALGIREMDENKFFDTMHKLLAINDILEHGGFERYGRPQKTEARIAFQNPSQFEFLAAMWLTKWASDDDRKWLRQHLPGNYDGHVEAINNVWRHLTEMPEAVRTRFECCWLRSIELLFQPVPEARHARPTEYMYRCWRTLLAYAAPDWAEVSVLIPQLKTVNQTDDRFTEIRDTARRILVDFRSKTASAQRTAERTAWVWCPPQAANAATDASQRTFWMGTPEEKRGHEDFREWLPEPFQRVTIPLDFEMQAAPVTNLEFEQFDAWHKTRRGEDSSDDGQSVIDVSLFDSFLYACWMGPEYRLPTEKEWEFACRAGSPPGQLRWWHDDDDRSKRWADDNSKNKVPISTAKHANAWGVQDQIGLVWEWTSTRAEKKEEYIWNDEVRERVTPDVCVNEGESPVANPQTAFVLRGGSWNSDGAANLRCGRRDLSRPTLTGNHTGCRLSRVARARKP